MLDKKVMLGIAIVKELSKGRYWKTPDGYEIGMGEDYSIGFVMTKDNGERCIGGLTSLTLKDIIKLAEIHGVDAILPADPLKILKRRAEELDW